MNARNAQLATAFVLSATALHAQVGLNTLNTAVLIDLQNTVTGVNNGSFDAQTPSAAQDPAAGQLDLDAWNYVGDGTGEAAEQGAGNYPGSVPDGNGIGTGGSLVTGLSAVDINGHRALAIQATSGHWTAGNFDLRVINNTGGTVDDVDIGFSVYCFNDAERSNTVRFFYSLSSQEGSFVEVPAAQVTSPAAADASPDWVEHAVAITIGGFDLEPGDMLYLRWEGNDVEGSGVRDEFAFTDFSLTPHASAGPTLAAAVTGLAPFAQTVGTPSASQSFLVSGHALTDDITVNAPLGHEVSLSASNGFANNIDLVPNAGSVPPTAVYVRLNSATAGVFEGNVQVSSPGAVSGGVHVSGTASGGAFPQVFINEFMASNDAYLLDPFGDYDDWFELYNPNATPVDLAGWYCTDNASQLTKYQFSPDSTVATVPAHGWLLVWADSQPEQGDLHTNFSLSGGGEYLALVAPSGVDVVDSITFHAQAPDTSYGRASDGGEPWVIFPDPTPDATNGTTFIVERQAAPALRAWPVPANGDRLFVDRTVSGVLIDAQGRTVGTFDRTRSIGLNGLAPGTYFLRTTDGAVLQVLRN